MNRQIMKGMEYIIGLSPADLGSAILEYVPEKFAEEYIDQTARLVPEQVLDLNILMNLPYEKAMFIMSAQQLHIEDVVDTMVYSIDILPEGRNHDDRISVVGNDLERALACAWLVWYRNFKTG